MKTLLFLMLLLVGNVCNAQYGDNQKGNLLILAIFTRVEVTSINEKTFLSFGPKIPFSDNDYIGLKGHFKILDIAGNKKLIAIPELDYIRTIAKFEDGNFPVTNLFTGAGVSPYAVSPKFGVSLYHLLSAEVGYNFEFNEYKRFPTKGFRFSFGLNFIM